MLLGNSYRPGIDYDPHSFAPCAQQATARLMALDALQHGKCLKSCDVKQAFTFGKAERRCFVKCPPGKKQSYDASGSPLVYEIMKNLYGSPSGPKRWHVEIHNALVEHGFKQSCTDQCLYTQGCLSVLVYSDDCMSTFDDTPDGHRLYESFIGMMTSKFELGNDGFQDCENFVGMYFQWSNDRQRLHISQPQKTRELLETSGMLECKPAYTPGTPDVLVSLLDCPSEDDVEEKRSMKPAISCQNRTIVVDRS